MFAGVLVFLLVGCPGKFNYKAPGFSLRHQGTEYTINQKTDLSVNLCINADFRTAKWQKKILGSDFTIFLGDQLAKNASEMTDILFKNVIISRTPIPNAANRVDAILTPKIMAIERTMGATSLGESILLVVLEWRLEDTQGNIIWIDTIKGMGRAPTGNIYNHKRHTESQLRMLLKDLFHKSFQSAKKAVAIRQYVARKPLLPAIETSTPTEQLAESTTKQSDTATEAVLTKSQIHMLFADKTVTGIHNRKDFTFTRFFSADGSLTETSSQKIKRKGNWTTHQNELCIEWKKGKKKCRKIKKVDGVIKQYKQNKRGKMVLIVTYETFSHGQ